MRTKRVVVAAACRSGKQGVTFVGARHFDTWMQKQMEALYRADFATEEEHPPGDICPNKWHKYFGKMEDGFIDNRGNFLTRESAMELAIEAGQNVDIAYGCGGNDKVLFSEGLY